MANDGTAQTARHATTEKSASSPSGKLHRVVGVYGATLLGLGSILGTGVFVSIGIAAGIAGAGVVLAVALAAVVATFNGLSSAQLAASHPVSGGTYEYGYRYLNPTLGFVAGWMFLCAKSASAATAALGFAGYFLHAIGVSNTVVARSVLGTAAVMVLTLVVVAGMRRSNRANAIIVSVTLLSLLTFVFAGAPAVVEKGTTHLTPFIGSGDETSLLHATALMFVAYTGYGRVATLGEEVVEPERTIPRAIVLTLVTTAVLYVAVALVAVASSGATRVAEVTHGAAAPLELIARGFDVPGVAWLVAVGAITAMLGVLINLLLGLSRVLLAMARRHDMPHGLALVHAPTASPRRATLVIGALITTLVLIGDVKTTWSFSAFTVLIYYALTNLAAWRLPASARRFPRAIAAAGFVSCLGLAFWVDVGVWLTGLGLLAAGVVWHKLMQKGATSRGVG